MASGAPGDLAVGIDFGTSNTVVALADADGGVEAIRFDHSSGALKVFVTALSFSREGGSAGQSISVEGGPWAVDAFLEGRESLRFIQSFKMFAASASFQETRIFRERYRFEDLLAAFLRTLKRRAGPRLDFAARSIVVGRPVRFAGRKPDDGLAMTRYRTAFTSLGAPHAAYVYEPVGAASFFARRLTRDATVLVADFGGGTSDFSVIRFRQTPEGLTSAPLGHAGVGVAGDAFDYRIVDRLISPRFGKGGNYRSFGKALTIPNRYYSNFARWSQLMLMKTSGELKDLRELERSAVDPSALRHFIDIIEYDHGFALYRAVSGAKIALSAADETDLVFEAESFSMRARVTRADFEGWIADDLARIGAAIDEALANAGLSADAIDRVFLTGGSSYVPAVRRLFAERFPDDRIETGDQFESIAYGLALIGARNETAAWASVQ